MDNETCDSHVDGDSLNDLVNQHAQELLDRHVHPATEFIATATGRCVKDPIGNEDEILAQIAHLRWRKMQNDNKIQSVLTRSNRQHEKEMLKHISRDRAKEKIEWMNRIVQEEMEKPLTVDAGYMHALATEEEQTRKRQLKTKRLHLRSVKEVHKKLAERHSHAQARNVTLRKKIKEAEDLCADYAEKHAAADAELRERYLIEKDNGSGESADFAGMDMIRRRIRHYYEAQENAEQGLCILREKLERSLNEAKAINPKARDSTGGPVTEGSTATSSVVLKQKLSSLKETLDSKGISRRRRTSSKTKKQNDMLAAYCNAGAMPS